MAAVCALVPGGQALAQESLADTSPRLAWPRSHVNDPFDAPIMVGLFVAGGGGTEVDQGPFEVGYGGHLVFRPGAAVSFLDFLYDWNAGLVLQVDHQSLSETDEVLSGDGIIRRYFRDRGQGDTEVRLFAGLGLGASRFSVPGTGGSKVQKYWSGVAEVGQEWMVDEQWIITMRAQYRMNLSPHNHWGAWSLQLGLGVPWPI